LLIEHVSHCAHAGCMSKFRLRYPGVRLRIIETMSSMRMESGCHKRRREPAFQNSRGEGEIEPRPDIPNLRQGPNPSSDRPQERRFPLGMVLKACPGIVEYARHGISSWRDFVGTAGMVRSALGISLAHGKKLAPSWARRTPQLSSRQSYSEAKQSTAPAAISAT
jgi:hypothetical protein